MFDSINMIKVNIACDNLDLASEAYYELSDEEKMLINLPPTKGGIFTTEEREVIKSKEFREAHFGPAPEREVF